MTYLNALQSGYFHLFDRINLGLASQSTQMSPIRKLIRYIKPNLTCLQVLANQSDQGLTHYAEENTLFFMQGPRGGPRFFYFDVTNVF